MNWEGKRVLITGHTGFKGSWLSLWLQLKGAEVYGVSLSPPTQPNLFTIASVQQVIGLRSLTLDLRFSDLVYNVFYRYGPEIVFHLAAQPIVRSSYKNPADTYSTNIMGTVNVLEAARKTKSVKAIVVVTSDKSYANQEWDWPYRESDRLGGYDPYSASKACVELVVASYRKSFNMNIATARAGNVIGGGDWGIDRLVPDVMRAFTEGKTVKVRNPSSIRPWQHVLEPLQGYIMLAESLYDKGSLNAEEWNFGPVQYDEWTVLDIVKELSNLWGDEAFLEIVEHSQEPHETASLTLDWSKAKRRLGWHPRLSLKKSLSLTCDWYKAWMQHRNMKEFTLDQIRSYE